MRLFLSYASSASAWFVLLALLLTPGLLCAVDYQVGPGQTYLAIGDVPWEALAPGDRVLIHWRDSAYQEKWVIARL